MLCKVLTSESWRHSRNEKWNVLHSRQSVNLNLRNSPPWMKNQDTSRWKISYSFKFWSQEDVPRLVWKIVESRVFFWFTLPTPAHSVNPNNLRKVERMKFPSLGICSHFLSDVTFMQIFPLVIKTVIMRERNPPSPSSIGNSHTSFDAQVESLNSQWKHFPFPSS